MIEVTNIAPGPRGLNTKDGPVMLASGETRGVDLEKFELAVAERTGWFEFEGQSKKAAAENYDKMTDEELRAILKNKGVAIDGRWGRDKLAEEARKANEAA